MLIARESLFGYYPCLNLFEGIYGEIHTVKFIRNNWRVVDLSRRLYSLGTISLLVPIAVMFLTKNHNIFSIAATLPAVCFLTGFLLWSLPKMRRLIRSTAGRVAVLLCQAVLVPLAIGLANQITGACLGLPPQSFSATVSLVTVLSYPVVWGAALCAAVFLTALSAMLLASIAGPASILFQTTSWPWQRPLIEVRKAGKIETWLADSRTNLSNYGFGALFGALLSLVVVGYYAQALISPTVIRLAAYYLDFTYAPAYPGQTATRKMRLLDNGYVAYADRKGLRVDLNIVKQY